MEYDPRCTCIPYQDTNCTVKYHKCLCIYLIRDMPCIAKIHKCCCSISAEYDRPISNCLFLGLHECVCLLRHGKHYDKCRNEDFHKCICHIDQQKCISSTHNCSCNKSKLSVDTNTVDGCRKKSNHNHSCKTNPDTCRHKVCTYIKKKSLDPSS